MGPQHTVVPSTTISTIPDVKPVTDYITESDIKAFLHRWAVQLGRSEAQIREYSCTHYGSVDQAMKTLQGVEEDNNARALHVLSTNGYILAGPKPIEGDFVTDAKLREGLSIRYWCGKRLAETGNFCFDFINGEGQHMRTPPGVEIYSETTGHPVRSLEARMREQFTAEKIAQYTVGKIDEQHETYILQAGTRLRIVQPGEEVIYSDVPMHVPASAIRNPKLGCRPPEH